MNALNVSSRAVTLTRPYPPLVVDIGRGSFAWISNGYGFLLHTNGDRQWRPLEGASGIGGTVLDSSQVEALVESFGKPTP